MQCVLNVQDVNHWAFNLLLWFPFSFVQLKWLHYTFWHHFKLLLSNPVSEPLHSFELFPSCYYFLPHHLPPSTVVPPARHAVSGTLPQSPGMKLTVERQEVLLVTLLQLKLGHSKLAAPKMNLGWWIAAALLRALSSSLLKWRVKQWCSALRLAGSAYLMVINIRLASSHCAVGNALKCKQIRSRLKKVKSLSTGFFLTGMWGPWLTPWLPNDGDHVAKSTQIVAKG